MIWNYTDKNGIPWEVETYDTGLYESLYNSDNKRWGYVILKKDQSWRNHLIHMGHVFVPADSEPTLNRILNNFSEYINGVIEGFEDNVPVIN